MHRMHSGNHHKRVTIVELGEKGQMGINKQVIFTQTRECSSSVRIRLE